MVGTECSVGPSHSRAGRRPMRRSLAVLFLALAFCAAAVAPAAAELPVIYSGAYGYAHTGPTASPPAPTTCPGSPPPAPPPAPRRQRLVLSADRRPPAAGGPRPRHLRRPLEQLAGALAAAEEQRLVRLRPQLRLLLRQRRDRCLRGR